MPYWRRIAPFSVELPLQHRYISFGVAHETFLISTSTSGTRVCARSVKILSVQCLITLHLIVKLVVLLFQHDVLQCVCAYFYIINRLLTIYSELISVPTYNW